MNRSDKAQVMSFNSFFDVADWMVLKQCADRRRHGSCNCTARRRADWNPCEYAQRRIDNAMARAMGEGLPNDLTIDDLIAHAERRQCDKAKRGSVCSHKGCGDAMRAVGFLVLQRAGLAAAG